ncbi:hypothetical protein ACFL6C_06625 [Myxococcota bacterium]
MTIAALWPPDLPLQAILRAQPERANEPLVILKGQKPGGGAPILIASAAAQHSGVRAHMTVAQARALLPEVSTLFRDVVLETSACEALVDVARSFSPRVEVKDTAWVYLDVDGLERLVGPPDVVARALLRAARTVGLEICVGVARTKTLARLAALSGPGCAVVCANPRAERDFVARLPLEALEPTADLLATLRRFGLRRAGDFLALPIREVSTRLGPAGVRLLNQARGAEDGGLRPTPASERFTEQISLDHVIDNLEPLAFVLRGALDRLAHRLSMRGYIAGNIHLSLEYEGSGRCERVVEVTPSRDMRALLSLCRLSLAREPPGQPITRVVVEVEPIVQRQRQLALFEPAGPAPDKLAITVARLQELCGHARVGVPKPVDSYCDDAFEVSVFDGQGPCQTAPLPEAPPVALRRFRPPREVEVIWRDGVPVRLESRELRGRIIAVSGPFRRNEGWWTAELERGQDIDIYDLQLTNGIAYRLTFLRQEQRWLAHGWYD